MVDYNMNLNLHFFKKIINKKTASHTPTTELATLIRVPGQNAKRESTCKSLSIEMCIFK